MEDCSKALRDRLEWNHKLSPHAVTGPRERTGGRRLVVPLITSYPFDVPRRGVTQRETISLGNVSKTARAGGRAAAAAPGAPPPAPSEAEGYHAFDMSICCEVTAIRPKERFHYAIERFDE
ncbi:hypothetical protein EVAR_95090_1 [Eumeta japonica]|uniref:Uncharacterized protein n=1 Tax=Eumeta variegata TaxID=151549 RepID=A0A4C1W5L8_EUMVA|nr:hypothetical protein EVAR_95090_1 [Eumeta japonica]